MPPNPPKAFVETNAGSMKQQRLTAKCELQQPTPLFKDRKLILAAMVCKGDYRTGMMMGQHSNRVVKEWPHLSQVLY